MDAVGTGHTLTFLGTAGSCGVPCFYCGCKACREALDDPQFRRNCSGVAVRGDQTVLIDTPPGLNFQLARFGVGDVDAVVYTHQHQDHTGGLPDLEFLVQLEHQGAPLPVYCNDVVAGLLPTRFEWMADCLDIQVIHPFQAFVLDGVSYLPLPASHTPGTLGFLLEVADDGSGSPRRTAYFPDTGPFPEETLPYLEGIERLIMDATFNGRNWMPQSHHSVDEALSTGRDLGVGELVLTHLTMHYDTPVTTLELEEKLAALEGGTTSFRLARDGMELFL